MKNSKTCQPFIRFVRSRSFKSSKNMNTQHHTHALTHTHSNTHTHTRTMYAYCLKLLVLFFLNTVRQWVISQHNYKWKLPTLLNYMKAKPKWLTAQTESEQLVSGQYSLCGTLANFWHSLQHTGAHTNLHNSSVIMFSCSKFYFVNCTEQVAITEL